MPGPDCDRELSEEALPVEVQPVYDARAGSNSELCTTRDVTWL